MWECTCAALADEISSEKSIDRPPRSEAMRRWSPRTGDTLANSPLCMLAAKERAGVCKERAEIHPLQSSSKSFDLLARDTDTQPALKKGCYARPFFW